MAWNYYLIIISLSSMIEAFEIKLGKPKNIEQISSQKYKLDPRMILAKDQFMREARILRRGKIDLVISGLESSFSWLDVLQGEDRLAVGFQLLQGKKYVENVVLYSPRDMTFRVLGLKDSTQYTGSVRLIRDKYQIQQYNNTGDVHQFRLDTPRIIKEKEIGNIQSFLTKVSSNKIKLDYSSVTFKLPSRIRDHYILEVHNLNESSVISKTEIHIVSNSKTIILNDLPPNSIMKMILRRVNNTSGSDDTTTSLMFTGSLTSGEDMGSASSITRLVMYNKDKLENTPQQTVNNEEKTVPCHVVNRRPFDGYPCPQSQVCLPLHWRCDGQQDCPGGLDEVGCEQHSYRSETLAFQEVTNTCKEDETSCNYNNITMCLPNKWMCDGREDCSDGWDEKDSCTPKATAYTLPSLTQGIRRITNLLLRCRGAHFRCRSGECVSDRSVCDGVNHCDDASDELYCNNSDDDDDDEDYEPDYVPDYEFKCHPRYEFKCYRSYSYSTRRCIPKSWLCDAYKDCPYGEDENDNFCSHQHLFQGYFN